MTIMTMLMIMLMKMIMMVTSIPNLLTIANNAIIIFFSLP